MLRDTNYKDRPSLKAHFSAVQPYVNERGIVPLDRQMEMAMDSIYLYRLERQKIRYYWWWPPIAWKIIWMAYQERKRKEYMEQFVDFEFKRIKKEKEDDAA